MPTTNGSDKPFTKALLLRGEHITRDSYRFWGIESKATTGDIAELASDAASLVAYEIIAKSLEILGRSVADITPKETDTRSYLIVAFSMLAIIYIQKCIADEGISIELKRLMVRTSKMFFLGFSESDILSGIRGGSGAFQQLISSDNKVMADWNDTLQKVLWAYVHQWTSLDPLLKRRDLMPAFGELLGTLLKMAD